MRLYPCGEFLLAFPNDHRLPDIQRLDVLYDRGWKSALKAISLQRPKSTIIDIGANVGDTAAFIRTHTANPILCVEGAKEFAPYLRHNAGLIGSGIEIIEAFVVPYPDFKATFTAETGTGYMMPGSTSEFEEALLSDVIDAARKFGDGEIALIKTDTDGMDAHIVNELIDLCPETPVFFECDYRITQSFGCGKLWLNVFDKLYERGSSAIIYDNHGLPMLCVDRIKNSLVEDLQGWIHCQHQLHEVNVHYLDMIIFPKSEAAAFASTREIIRQQLLAPYNY